MPPYNFALPRWGYLPGIPLPIAHLKSYLEEAGFRVDLEDSDIKIIKNKKFLDEMVKLEPKISEAKVARYLKTGEASKEIDRASEILFKLKDYQKYDVFGFSLIERKCLKYALILAKKIRTLKGEAGIVFGGRLVEVLPKFDLRGTADLIVFGSGEEKLLEFCQNFPKSIRKPSPEITENIRKPEITLKYRPDFSQLIPLYKGIKPVYGFHNFFDNVILPYIYSYGCPHNCSFCSASTVPASKKQIVWKKPQEIVEDLKFLKERCQSPYFHIYNEYVHIHLGDFKKLCRLLIKEKLNLTFYGCIRPDLPPRLIPLMKKAGFRLLSLGLESANDRILKLMRKGVNSRQLQILVNSLGRSKIYHNCYIIVGFPTETDREFRDTFDFVQKNIEKIDQISVTLFKLENNVIRQRPKSFGIKLRPGFVALSAHTQAGTVLGYDEIGGRSWEELLEDNYRNFYLLFRLMFVYQQVPQSFYRSSFNEIIYLMAKYNDHLEVQKKIRELYEKFKKKTALYLKITPEKNFALPQVLLEEKWSQKVYRSRQIFELIKKEAGRKKELVLTGEATFFEELFPLLRFAGKSGFENINLFTDGLKLADFNYARKLKENFSGHLSCYLLGHRASLHDKITRIPGSFRRMMRGIENWKRLGGKVELRPVLHSLNKKHLYEMLCLDQKLSNVLDVQKVVNAFMHSIR